MGQHVLVLDRGSASVQTADGRIVARVTHEVARRVTAEGWVEINPEALWTASLTACQAVMAKVGLAASDIAVLALAPSGIVAVWDRVTGRAIHDAIEAPADAIARILDQVPGAGEQAKTGRLVAGPIEGFLVWRLTLGATDIDDRDPGETCVEWFDGAIPIRRGPVEVQAARRVA